MFEALHNWEIGLLEALQHFRTPSRDYFFTLLNFFDSDYFYFILLPIVWAVCGRRWGLRLMYIILLSAIINNDVKDLFCQPRPSQIDPSLGIIMLSSYGFPSGAAQSSVILAGLGILAMPRFITVAFFTLYVGLISFSRIYLGAHFLTDVIGGWAIGLVLVLAYAQYHERLEKWAASLPVKKALFASFAIPLALYLPHPTIKTIIFTAMMFGVNIGLFLCAHLSGSAMKPLFSWQRKVCYVALAIAGIFLFGKNTTLFPKQPPNSLGIKLIMGVTYALIGVWLSWGIERLLSIQPNKP